MESTLDELVADVIAIMNHFEDDYDEFILLGHSQGGVVSTKVAAMDDRVAGIIFMASPMVPLKEVINEQIMIIRSSIGTPKEDIDRTLAFQEQAYEAARMNAGWDELKVAFKDLIEYELSKLPEAQQAFITDVDAFAEAQYNAQVAGIKTPQMRSLLHYDPIPDFIEADIPSLGIFGDKDTQVSVAQNATVYAEVSEANDLDHVMVTFSEANHLFQPAETGMIQEYASLPKEFVDDFLDSITKWVSLKY